MCIRDRCDRALQGLPGAGTGALLNERECEPFWYWIVLKHHIGPAIQNCSMKTGRFRALVCRKRAPVSVNIREETGKTPGRRSARSFAHILREEKALLFSSGFAAIAWPFILQSCGRPAMPGTRSFRPCRWPVPLGSAAPVWGWRAGFARAP